MFLRGTKTTDVEICFYNIYESPKRLPLVWDFSFRKGLKMDDFSKINEEFVKEMKEKKEIAEIIGKLANIAVDLEIFYASTREDRDDDRSSIRRELMMGATANIYVAIYELNNWLSFDFTQCSDYSVLSD